MKKIAILLLAALVIFVQCGCGAEDVPPVKGSGSALGQSGGLVLREHVENEYAEQFSIDRYEGGYSMITAMKGERFLVVPEGAEAPDSAELKGVSVIKQPARNFYIAATSAMGLFAEVGALDAVRFSGAKAEDWYIDEAKAAMERGEIIYAGKYREPDYELLLSGGCTLAVESTMIEHSPVVKEKLQELGIPVFIDYASYEPHPLGRSEWIRVYAEMCGKAAEADEFFSKQAEKLKSLDDVQSTGKTVAFFYINTAGLAVTRKSNDYITQMIELAGGSSVFKDGAEVDQSSAMSTVVMEMERFYTTAKDADFIIYNSTIGGEINSAAELISKNPLLTDFKAVKENNVWCTRENVYQETTKLGTMIYDFYAVFSGTASESDPPTFLYKLEGV